MASWLTRCWHAIKRQIGVGAASPAPGAPADVQSDLLTSSDPTPAAAPAASSFSKHRFAWDERIHPYRLFVPSLAADAPRPLLVMLHGCKQDSADFARGTGMNRLAQAKGSLVLYPEQIAKSNRMRCWNWYDRAHQGHAGEPAMIAALTRQVAQAQGVDGSRIYIAGLSAGGAMAAVVAALYPDVFAALGVHSGIPAGAASDVISAFSVMRRGATARAFAGRQDGLMPTIVFHGGADNTVHPDNSEQLVALALKALQEGGLNLKRSDGPLTAAPGGARDRSTQRTRWLGPDGKSYLEYWNVEEGPHAWSGGDQAGSFTDPHGPDASAAMLDFFLQHRRA